MVCVLTVGELRNYAALFPSNVSPETWVLLLIRVQAGPKSGLCALVVPCVQKSGFCVRKRFFPNPRTGRGQGSPECPLYRVEKGLNADLRCWGGGKADPLL